MNPVIPNKAKQAQLVIEGLLGDLIIGIYLFGSALMGGLKCGSDVDTFICCIRKSIGKCLDIALR